MNINALCRNLVRFGPVTPKFTLVKMTTHAKYLRMPWTDLYQLYNLVGIWYVGMIIMTFIWRSTKGRCYALLFALAFYNRFDGREAAFKRLNGNNPATSCTNLVVFHQIISDRVYTVKTRNVCRDSLQLTIDLHLAHWHSEITRVTGNHFCTHCRNLVRFRSVTLELKT